MIAWTSFAWTWLSIKFMASLSALDSHDGVDGDRHAINQFHAIIPNRLPSTNYGGSAYSEVPVII
jgi:hypothetical protein